VFESNRSMMTPDRPTSRDGSDGKSRAPSKREIVGGCRLPARSGVAMISAAPGTSLSTATARPCPAPLASATAIRRPSPPTSSARYPPVTSVSATSWVARLPAAMVMGTRYTGPPGELPEPVAAGWTSTTPETAWEVRFATVTS
jgi:hypothetical protein